MNKKIIHIVVFCLFITACSVDKKDLGHADSEKTQVAACQISRVAKIIDGNSMSPLLKNGQEIDLLENYYKCGNSVQKNDLVAYDYGGNERPLIKQVKVVSEDEVEFYGSKLRVNGEILKNSSGRDYSFKKGEINMLKLYIQDAHIPENTYFLFGDNVSISTDSRKFGAVSSVDFLGKFEEK